MSLESRHYIGETSEDTGIRSIRYLLHLPDEVSQGTERPWPLILFLHGRGECGDDLGMLVRHGLPKIVENQPDFPFITLSPQCPAKAPEWDPYIPLLRALLDQTIETYPVDPQRVYLTGLSMGGRGAWQFAVESPQRFAAVVPICARVPDTPAFLERLCVLKDKPVWVFHGGRDSVVSIENSETAVCRLYECGSNPRFTIYPEANHDSWTATYNDPELYAWLAEQVLPGPMGAS